MNIQLIKNGLFLLLICLLASCAGLKKGANSAESFDEFYDRFHTDMEFQLSRVSFPLMGNYVDLEGEQKWEKADWESHLQKVTEITDPNYDTSFVQTDTEVTDKVQLRGAGLSIERRFKLIEGKWYLVYYDSINL